MATLPVPIMRYAMDASNPGADSSASGLNMSNTNVALVTDADRGPVASFDANSVLTLVKNSVPSALLGSASRTLVYWIKHNKPLGGSQTLHKIDTGWSGKRFTISLGADNKQHISIYGGGAVGSTEVPANTWAQLAVTYESGVTKFYVNGTLNLSWNAQLNTGTNPFYIGGGYTGLMSDFRVYAEALTAAQLDADYLATVVDTSLFSTRPGPINIKVDVNAVPDAVGLKLTYQAPTGAEATAFAGFLSGPKNIKSLDPEVEYTVRLYVDSGSGYEMTEQQVVSTLANSASNYEVDDFVEDGKIQLDGLDAAAKTRMSAVMNELFTTGDKINVNLGGKRSKEAKFVNRGSTSRIDEAEALLLPFDAGSGSAQTINIQLSDDSTTAVVYDEVANTVAVESVVYSTGDSFLIDGQKCLVVEY